MTTDNKKLKIFIWALQIISGVILLMAGAFKFYAGDQLGVFTSLGMEPHGRYIIGVLELLCALLLFSEQLSALGAFLSVGIMLGASIAHATVIGISVNGDGGELFLQLIVVFICSLFITWFRRKQLPIIGSSF